MLTQNADAEIPLVYNDKVYYKLCLGIAYGIR